SPTARPASPSSWRSSRESRQVDRRSRARPPSRSTSAAGSAASRASLMAARGNWRPSRLISYSMTTLPTMSAWWPAAGVAAMTWVNRAAGRMRGRTRLGAAQPDLGYICPGTGAAEGAVAERADWSREEVEACVASYLRMLTLELNGQHYSKSEHANRLMKLLDGRNRPSVEFKHCNISAVMIALGYPYIRGYKPRGNFQGLLAEVVAAQSANNSALQAAAQAAAQQPAVATPPTDALSHWVPAPKPMRLQQKEPAPYQPRFV